ncbi:long-chain fatty acid--CoA ligase [Sporosarcina sp. ANT_H38]|uniref:class I adenylate-forming enzyme family protein n=1 Tax=Sporosarcina sp. ANT_H38 TaxID=2597358 RepID=UPI0011F13F25|nr:long-chain fatty acid--CoA ligase [Sporosarcina sp. ANT_H38]KAA0966863.1 long-chain fatty acid--CoA ligase [Sporosarcina sp. ANT_H38]
MYIAEKLKVTSEAHPERVITSFNGKDTSYGDFYRKAENLARHFQDLGYVKDDILAFCLLNSDSFLICYYACQIGGFTALPINTKLTAPEMNYILAHSEAKGLIYDERLAMVFNLLEGKLPALQHKLVTNHQFEAIIDGEQRHAEQRESLDADTAVVFYTSGTTGRPKGVMLTNRNIAAAAEIWSESMEMDHNDRVHIVAPLFHCAASHVFSIPVIYRGGMVIIEEAFSPEATIRTMEQQRATIFFGVPAMYSILLNTPSLEKSDLSNLRLFCYGAAPMPYELVKKVKALFPDVNVQNLYGQTENSPGATTLKDQYALSKIGSVGKPLPQTEIQVMDELGRPLPAGQVGEIAVKGPQVMKGYLRNEEETARTIKDGWMYSGDLGRFDEDGLLYIVDRKKDMIIRGGENVYPVEVEEVLYAIPEVLEAAVVGIPHEIYGEVVKACIVLKEENMLSEQAVIDFCKSQLASFKIPAVIEFLASLPRNASGKVLKTILRDPVNIQ